MRNRTQEQQLPATYLQFYEVEGVVLLCLLAFASTEIPTTKSETEPLHQFNSAVRKLVKPVTPSVWSNTDVRGVQALRSGIGNYEA